jgi:membrane protein implicated in regulation of membrane protease activity
MIKKLWQKIKNFFKWLWLQLRDKTNIVIFIISFLLLSSEVWIPYLLALITGNNWWWAIGSTCWAFWLAPFTPFLPICLALTFLIRKIYDKIVKRKNDKKNNDDEEKDEK